ncbi:Reverse transcriptase domain-containing protein, partial [Aphis craccivora]
TTNYINQNDGIIAFKNNSIINTQINSNKLFFIEPEPKKVTTLIHSNNYLNLINEYGFTSLVNCMTRTKEIGGSCLDHILIKSNTLTNSSTETTHQNPKIVKLVDYLKLSMHDSNVNCGANKFIEILKHEENNCSLEKKISSKTKNIKPWAIILSIRRRDKLHLTLKKHPLNEKLKEYYLKYRNTLTNIIKKAKTKYYKSELEK